MAHLPAEERVVAGLDLYDSLNNLEADNYDQRYYIEKESLKIDFLSEDEKEGQEVEEVKDDLSQLKLHEDCPKTTNIPATSSRTYDDLVTIHFSHPAPSPTITLEGLVGLQTPESRIDPHNQFSTSAAATSSQTTKALLVIASSPPLTNQGGVAT